MGEAGLSASEVGKEIAEHRQHTLEGGEATGRDRRITIIEALLLAVVAVLAAWSGYAAAKWGTEAQLNLAQASAARTQSNQANLTAMESRNFDASTFNTWFTAYTTGNQAGMTVAERRFRPEFKVGFDAWMVTNPFTSADAPPGPTFMPEYQQPDAGSVLFLVGISGHFRVRVARYGLVAVGGVIMATALIIVLSRRLRPRDPHRHRPTGK